MIFKGIVAGLFISLAYTIKFGNPLISMLSGVATGVFLGLIVDFIPTKKKDRKQQEDVA